ncbi:MAG: class I SAM-dependent methyltransferase [Winogradskyella sp.]
MSLNKPHKAPWPTKAVMEQIYEKHFWGGQDHDFYSGEGSHQKEIIQPYLESVISFFKSHNNKLQVCDLGCGDFNIGKQLAPYTSKYIGIDIVESLIVRNKKRFQREHISFHCLDIAKDELPQGDCAILRQVLQHLSNNEIINIVSQLTKYKYIILTEHLPNGAFTSNLDIISGQGIRLKQNSGVDLLKYPFHLQYYKKELLNTYKTTHKGIIETNLFTSLCN